METVGGPVLRAFEPRLVVRTVRSEPLTGKNSGLGLGERYLRASNVYVGHGGQVLSLFHVNLGVGVLILSTVALPLPRIRSTAREGTLNLTKLVDSSRACQRHQISAHSACCRQRPDD